MILSGREIQALLGAAMIQEHVPFVRSVKRALSPHEHDLVDSASDTLRAARTTISPKLSRDTPGWLDLMHRSEIEVVLSRSQVDVLAKVSSACLAELRSDGELSAHVGGVGLAALRSAHKKLADHQRTA